MSENNESGGENLPVPSTDPKTELAFCTYGFPATLPADPRDRDKGTTVGMRA
jgi:hypothetical protein